MQQTATTVPAAGISLAEVTDELVADGIRKFQEPFDKLMATLERRCRG